MPQTATFVLQPLGRFRFGSHPANPGHLDPLPASDTLFGALASAAALLGDGIDDLVARFAQGEPPFLISSAQPHLEGRDPLVPRPYRLRAAGQPAPPAPGAAATDDTADPQRKALKRVQYVERGALPWLDGAALQTHIWGPLLLLGQAPPWDPPWERDTIPGVTVDRLSSGSALYHHALIAYTRGQAAPSTPWRQRLGREPVPAPRLAWAMHVWAEDTDSIDLLHRWLELLALTGIGGRRSRGAGGFTVTRHEPALLPISPEPRGLLLSWVSPRTDEVDRGLFHPERRLGYRTDERFGWINSPLWLAERSRRVLMVAEGSYLSPDLPAPVGRLADVTPGDPQGRHRVFRYGFGLFLDEERLP